jgi:hypothetical protein
MSGTQPTLDDLRDDRFHVAHLIDDIESGALSQNPEWLAELKRDLSELDERIRKAEDEA